MSEQQSERLQASLPQTTDAATAGSPTLPPEPLVVATPEMITHVITYAWRRFNSYDEQSKLLKQRYCGIRKAIIAISWLTTLLAVLSTFAGDLKPLFNLILVVLPLISAGLLAFASRFESGIAWVGFRVAAETIRRSIYTLRVRAHLAPLTQTDLKGVVNLVHQTSDRLESMGVTTPMLTTEFPRDAQGRVQPSWLDRPQEDDGYTPMSIEDYIHWRLEPQTDWYRRRVANDYRRTRWYRATILIVGGMGAFLAAAGLGEFVAVTVASVTALVAWLSLMQYETGYNIFMRTIVKLEDALGSFQAEIGPAQLDPATLTEAQKEEILRFVNQIEEIFNEERELWRLSVLQGQEATENALAQMVSTYGKRFDFDSLVRPATSEAQDELELEEGREESPPVQETG